MIRQTWGMKLIYNTDTLSLFSMCACVCGAICNVGGAKAGSLTRPHLIVEVTEGHTQYHDYVCNSLLVAINKYKWNKSQVRHVADNLIKLQGIPIPKGCLTSHPKLCMFNRISIILVYTYRNIYVCISYIYIYISYIYIYIYIHIYIYIYIYVYVVYRCYFSMKNI